MVPYPPSHPAAARRAPDRLTRFVAAAAVAATLAGCGTAPLSFVNDRQVYHRAVLHRYPVVLIAVDGAYTAFHPVPVAPGTHLLTVDAAPVAGFTLPVQKKVSLTIEPCTRYYIAAQRESPMQQDWQLVVEETFAVGGCDPAKELEKAKTSAISGLSAPTSSLVAARPTANDVR